jgi:hypothetical protein
MDQNKSEIIEKQLSPDFIELRQALNKAARHAKRIADAFGLKVPTNQNGKPKE